MINIGSVVYICRVCASTIDASKCYKRATTKQKRRNVEKEEEEEDEDEDRREEGKATTSFFVHRIFVSNTFFFLNTFEIVNCEKNIRIYIF